jgi:UDP-glucuronate decarboxylase
VLAEDLRYLRSKQDGDAFTGQTIVITGFAGFLGYYFCQYLLTLDIRRLILLDNFCLRKPDWVAALASDARVDVRAFDIVRDEYTGADLAAANYVVHMASIASPTFYRQHPIATFEANVLGLRTLLEFYRDSSCLKGLLFFSSSEIYGEPSLLFVPTDEDFPGEVSCTGPRACYDESKRIGETLCYIYAQTYGMPIGVARPFNNYGPGMSLDDRRLPADFAKAVLSGQNIIIHSDGRPTRTYCYVADALDGYLRILTAGNYDYYNIGMDFPMLTVSEMAELYCAVAQELYGYNGTIEYQPSDDPEYLVDNPKRRGPSITKARILLGYEPQIRPVDGIRRYLRFLHSEQELP